MIAYLSYPNFADCDMPLLHELQQQADVTYILQIAEKNKKKTLVDVPQLKKRGGVYRMTDFPALQNLSTFIDISKAYVLNMPGRHDWSPQNLWATLCMLIFLIRHRYSIIHLTWPLRYGCFLLYLLHRRMLLTMHDPLPHSSEDTRLNRFHRRVALRLIPRFILLNSCQREEFLTNYHIRGERVLQSQLSVFTHLRQTTPIVPSAAGYVLFIGGINTHKGVDVLCQAMQDVSQHQPDAKLVVAGSGKLYFDTTPYQQAGFLDLHNRYLSDAELAGFIRNASFVVCPYTDATQSGVIMSAFALSKPVIATNVGGLPEMVCDGRHGLIVPPKDADALATAISRLLKSPELLTQMEANIRHDYDEAERSWRHIAATFVTFYSSASGTSPAGSPPHSSPTSPSPTSPSIPVRPAVLPPAAPTPSPTSPSPTSPLYSSASGGSPAGSPPTPPPSLPPPIPNT